MTKARTLADFDASTALTGNINLTSQVTGTLPVANGGTNLSSGFVNGGNTLTDCAFSAVPSTAQNVTGDGTYYYLTAYESPIYNIGSDFNSSTGKFIAPVTGKYQFNLLLHYAGVTGSHTRAQLKLRTTNRNYTKWYNPTGENDSGNVYGVLSVLADMDSGEEAHMQLAVFNGTKVVDIADGGMFSGFLVNE